MGLNMHHNMHALRETAVATHCYHGVCGVHDPQKLPVTTCQDEAYGTTNPCGVAAIAGTPPSIRQLQTTL